MELYEIIDSGTWGVRFLYNSKEVAIPGCTYWPTPGNSSEPSLCTFESFSAVLAPLVVEDIDKECSSRAP